ncbi:MAG: hypothetical protein K2W96_07865 [Gemmataceae bacterium]|nr:hypothetical protein [Gemmataceae bacterium]
MSILGRVCGFLVGLAMLGGAGYAAYNQHEADQKAKNVEATVLTFKAGFRGKHVATVAYVADGKKLTGFLRGHRCDPGERIKVLVRPGECEVFADDFWSRYAGWAIMGGVGLLIFLGSLAGPERPRRDATTTVVGFVLRS